MFEYTLPTDINEWFVKGNHKGTYFEIPAAFNEDGSLNLEETEAKILAFKDTRIFNDVMSNVILKRLPTSQDNRGNEYHDYKKPLLTYVDKELIRYDYDIKDPEAYSLLEELNIDLTSDSYTLIGANSKIRPPYSNRTISVYVFDTLPEDVIDQFGVDTSVFKNLYEWYGRKYDMVTGEVQLKIVCAAEDVKEFPAPILPEGFKFYSRMYTQDKAMTSHVDCYIWAYPSVIVKYCRDNNLLFPAPDNVANSIGLWGVAYDANTLEILTVKAYEFVPN